MKAHELVAIIVLTVAVLLGAATTWQNQQLINGRRDAVARLEAADARIEALAQAIAEKVGAQPALGPPPPSPVEPSR